MASKKKDTPQAIDPAFVVDLARAALYGPQAEVKRLTDLASDITGQRIAKPGPELATEKRLAKEG